MCVWLMITDHATVTVVSGHLPPRWNYKYEMRQNLKQFPKLSNDLYRLDLDTE